MALLNTLSLNHMREEEMEANQAIRKAAGNHIRPIFMTILTSGFGMFPPALLPGAGSATAIEK